MLVPFLIQTLGTEGYGLASLVTGIVALTTVVDMGLRGALTRQLAAEQAREDALGFNRAISSALAFYSGLGVAVLAMCYLGAPSMAHWFKVSGALYSQGVTMIRFYAGFALLIALVRPAYAGVLASVNRYDLLNFLHAGTGILKGVVLIALLNFTDTGLMGYAFGSLACLVLQLAATVWAAHRVYPHLSIRPTYVHPAAMKALFSLAGYFFVVNLIGVLGVHVDPLILTTMLGPEAIAFYRPAVQLSVMGQTLVLAMSWQLQPLATTYHVTGQKQEMRKLLIRATRYTLLMGIPVTVFLVCFAEPISAVWLGGQEGFDYRITARLLALAAFAELFTYAGGGQWPTMVGMKKVGFAVALNLPLAAVRVLVSIYLVGYTRLGITGILVPTVGAFAIRRIGETVYTARVSGVPFIDYIRSSFVRPFIVLVLLATFAWLYVSYATPKDLSTLLLSAFVMGVLWAVLCWFVGFHSRDRHSMLNLLPGRASRPAETGSQDEEGPESEGAATADKTA